MSWRPGCADADAPALADPARPPADVHPAAGRTSHAARTRRHHRREDRALNATTWEQLAQREIARAEREHSRLAIFILDLDFFKNVNDQHGHLVGHAALVDVAQCLTHELRTYDVIGRFGGEEFVALLPDIDLPEARRVAERIRERIAAVSITPMGSPH